MINKEEILKNAKRKSSAKRRLSLMFSLSVALLSVLTAAVSTYAWFSATASIDIDTESTTTTITVAAPETKFTFYSYNGNRNNANALGNDHTFEDDFTQITASNNSTLTSLSNMYPGEKMIFALKIGSLTPSTSPVGLKLHKLISMTNDDYLDNSSNHLRNHRNVFVNSVGIPVNIGWAINIYTHCIAESAYHYHDDLLDEDVQFDVDDIGDTISTTDKFTFASNTATSTFFANASQNSSTREWTFNNGYDIQLYSGTASAETMLLFYVIEFSTADDVIFKEVDYTTGLVYLPHPPIITDEKSANYKSGDHHYDNRRFVKYDNSDSSNKSKYNSNCFTDLGFEIKNLILV